MAAIYSEYIKDKKDFICLLRIHEDLDFSACLTTLDEDLDFFPYE